MGLASSFIVHDKYENVRLCQEGRVWHACHLQLERLQRHSSDEPKGWQPVDSNILMHVSILGDKQETSSLRSQKLQHACMHNEIEVVACIKQTILQVLDT